jgi:hypothetical protein
MSPLWWAVRWKLYHLQWCCLDWWRCCHEMRGKWYLGCFFYWCEWRWWKGSEKRLKSVMLKLDQGWFCLVSMKKEEKQLWLYSSTFLKKAGTHNRFMLRSLLLFSMDFTTIYKGWKKGMRCLSGMNHDP